MDFPKVDMISNRLALVASYLGVDGDRNLLSDLDNAIAQYGAGDSHDLPFVFSLKSAEAHSMLILESKSEDNPDAIHQAYRNLVNVKAVGNFISELYSEAAHKLLTRHLTMVLTAADAQKAELAAEWALCLDQVKDDMGSYLEEVMDAGYLIETHKATAINIKKAAHRVQSDAPTGMYKIVKGVCGKKHMKTVIATISESTHDSASLVDLNKASDDFTKAVVVNEITWSSLDFDVKVMQEDTIPRIPPSHPAHPTIPLSPSSHSPPRPEVPTPYGRATPPSPLNSQKGLKGWGDGGYT